MVDPNKNRIEADSQVMQEIVNETSAMLEKIKKTDKKVMTQDLIQSLTPLIHFGSAFLEYMKEEYGVEPNE